MVSNRYDQYLLLMNLESSTDLFFCFFSRLFVCLTFDYLLWSLDYGNQFWDKHRFVCQRSKENKTLIEVYLRWQEAVGCVQARGIDRWEWIKLISMMSLTVHGTSHASWFDRLLFISLRKSYVTPRVAQLSKDKSINDRFIDSR